MLADYFNEELLAMDVRAKTPEAVIETAGQLLVAAGKVKPAYVQSMVDSYRSLGPYIVIAPGIAIPHGKPGELVNEPCISFCKLADPVCFHHPDNDPVKYVFALGGCSPTGHISLLKDLSAFLMDKNNIKELESIKTKEAFLGLLKKGGGAD